ncbi:MAG: mechanosensitive ion channel family protein [Candidatus Aminicenantes bacterium]|nr:mechanosensitive ion channel family protein [Candidatus Aminicenantes bacterium]
MNNPQLTFSNFYSGLLIVLFAFVIAAVLSYGLRLLFKRILGANRGTLDTHFSRLISPLVFLLAAYFLRFAAAKGYLSISEKLFKYIYAVILFLLIMLIVRLFDSLLRLWYIKRRIPFPLPKVLHSFILIILYLIIFFVILNGVLGINITPFLATSAVLTMILGLALQGVLGNIFSGLSVHITDTLNSGDWIKVGVSNEGRVIETSWRATKIIDRNSNIVVIPNNVIASEILINYSQPDKNTCLNFPLKISYNAPPASVRQALEEAASDVPDIIGTPAPEVLITGFDDFGVSYILKFWISDYSQKNSIMSKVGQIIWYKLKRKNIEIPIPLSEKVSDVLKSVQEFRGISVEKKELEINFKDLKNSQFFNFLKTDDHEEMMISDDQIRELTDTIRRKRYSAGETLFRQGDKGESCYIVASGRLKGIITYVENKKSYKKEFFVEQGGLFGEMSLFTGMPRIAAGYVEEESELFEITAHDFAQLLARNPSFADQLAEIVSSRNTKNQEFFKQIKELSDKDIKESCNKNSILKRLKSLMLKWTS